MVEYKEPILCPHGYIIAIEMFGKIVIFNHDDGTPCDLLNGFDTTIEDINKETLRRKTTSTVKIALSTCETVIEQHCKIIESAYIYNGDSEGRRNLLHFLQELNNLGLLPLVGAQLTLVYGKLFFQYILQLNAEAAVRIENVLGKNVTQREGKRKWPPSAG